MILGVVFSLLAFCTQANEAIAQLGSNEFVRGGFIQERHLKNFSQPLVSKGVFSYWQKEGVYWEVQKPFFRAVTYGRGNTIHWLPNGKPAQVVKADVIQKLVSRVILAMLSADLDLLSGQFSVDIQSYPESWGMVLRPKLKAVAQAIQRVDIYGADYLQKIDLISTNGDKTIITFIDTEQALRPSKAECRHFFSKPDQRCD